MKRWALSDRVFFACGACHVLAWAFLDRYPAADRRPRWIRPASGQAGHIVVATEHWIFDDHGDCDRVRYIDHIFAPALRRGDAIVMVCRRPGDAVRADRLQDPLRHCPSGRSQDP